MLTIAYRKANLPTTSLRWRQRLPAVSTHPTVAGVCRARPRKTRRKHRRRGKRPKGLKSRNSWNWKRRLWCVAIIVFSSYCQRCIYLPFLNSEQKSQQRLESRREVTVDSITESKIPVAPPSLGGAGSGKPAASVAPAAAAPVPGQEGAKSCNTCGGAFADSAAYRNHFRCVCCSPSLLLGLINVLGVSGIDTI